jgi:hypothetical protein
LNARVAGDTPRFAVRADASKYLAAYLFLEINSQADELMGALPDELAGRETLWLRQDHP